MSNIDDLVRLKELHDSGAITQDEYNKQKEKILANPEPNRSASANSTSNQDAQQTHQSDSSSDQGAQQSYGQTPPPNQGGQQTYQNGQQAYQYRPTHNPGTPYESYEEDVAINKIFGIISYIWILFLVTIFAPPKESYFSRFHANQGLVLFLFEIAGMVVLNTLSGLTGIATVATLGAATGLLVLIGIVSCLYSAAMIVLAILGIISAAKGEMKPLPIIGHLQLLKK